MEHKLTDEEYRVLRQKGTEMPFSGEYVNEKAAGTYRCKGCGTPLFASDTKFDSGTGWPSFDQALPGAVAYHDDPPSPEGFGVASEHRTEVVCSTCGGHLGHVFDDGPSETTGKRYCINSVCLNLEKKKDN